MAKSNRRGFLTNASVVAAAAAAPLFSGIVSYGNMVFIAAPGGIPGDSLVEIDCIACI